MNRTSPEREYNRAVTQLIIVSLFGAFGGVFSAFSLYGYNNFGFDRMVAVIMFGFGAVILATSGIPFVFVIEALRITRGGGGAPTGGNDASNILDFDQAHTPARARIVSQRENNQLLRCSYGFTPNQWLRLVNSLAANNWIWSRDHSVRPANIFTAEITPGTSLTRAADWRRVCQEFERLNTIRKRGGSWRVTEEGRESLCFIAGLNVVI